MNKKYLLCFVVLLLILTVINLTVFAQEPAIATKNELMPSFAVTEVSTGKTAVILTRDFPADTDFFIRLAEINSNDYVDVAKFNTQTGGSFKISVPIPEQFADLPGIAILLTDNAAYNIPGTFINNSLASVVPQATQTDFSTPVVLPPPPHYPPYYGYPTFQVITVDPGKTVTILINNLPPYTTFTVTIGAYNPCAQYGYPAGTIGAESSAEFEAVINIPVEVADVAMLSIRLQSTNGYFAYNWFNNLQVSATENAPSTTVPSVATAQSQCDYSTSPSFTIKNVIKGESVTVQTQTFAKASVFNVKMGVSVNTNVPSWWSHTYPQTGPGPVVIPSQTWFSGGIDVGTLDTKDNSQTTYTFKIPESLKMTNPIMILIEDSGPCGYYAYNYFWNNDSEVITTVPTIVTQ